MMCQNRIYTGLLIALMISLSSLSYGQTEGPNCRDIHPSVDADGFISMTFGQLVSNMDPANVFPGEVTVKNQWDGVIQRFDVTADTDPFMLLVCPYLGRTLKVEVKNSLGACHSKLTFKQDNPPVVMGRTDTIWCTDAAVNSHEAWEELADGPPLAMIPCKGPMEAEFVADWIEPNDTCDQDVAKIIYREYAAYGKDGQRGSTFDTITVFRLPAISSSNTEAPPVDTMYCGVTAFPRMVGDSIQGYYTGPRMYKYNPNTMECDTLWFCYVIDENNDGWLQDSEWKTTNDLSGNKCGLVFKKKIHKFEDSCSPVYKIDLEVKQLCAGGGGVTDPNCPAQIDFPISAPTIPGYFTFSWWVYDIDTLPPVVDCKLDDYEIRAWTDPDCEAFGPGLFDYNSSAWERTVVVPAGSHDCVAHTYLPPVVVEDDWSGIKTVKAQFNGSTYIFEPDNAPNPNEPYGPSKETFRHHSPVKVPKAEWPTMIVYEAFDNCHLVSTDTCYIMTKDQTAPVAVVDKGVTVSLSDKKVWVYAESFDEGSWDNCGDPRIFVRRTDWMDACIDLCENIVDGECAADNPTKETALEFCYASEHHDTLWRAILEEDKDCDPVEAHYAKQMEWWCHDGTPCGRTMYNAWVYDLIKHGTLVCGDISDPHEVDKLIEESLMLGVDEEEIAALEALVDRGVIEMNEGFNRFLDALRFGKFKIELPHLHECHYFGAEGSSLNRTLNAVIALVNIGTMNLSEEEIERIIGLLDGSIPITRENVDEIRAEAAHYFRVIVHAYQEWIRAELDNLSQLGGGWSDAVAFDCEDACQNVTVEVLAIDYWCNWSKSWTEVWVEDKTPVQVAADVTTDFDISCKTYKYLGLDVLVADAEAGDADALESLNDMLGGYHKVWRDAHGNLVDADGEVVDQDLTVADSACFCRDTTVEIRVHDEHLGYIWEDSTYSICGYNSVPIPLTHGAVVVNCAQNVSCSQTVWSTFDHCGQGVIYRKFKIWQDCEIPAPDNSRSAGGDGVDTLTRLQKIWIGNECDLEMGMFEAPADVTVDACGVEYDPNGSGNVVGVAHPESTGYLTYTFDDDCRIVGVGHYDKVFKIVGGDEGCYKIIRTWCYTDWCETEKPLSDEFWSDPSFNGEFDTYVQKIIVRDLTPPSISIVPVTDAAARGSCAFNLATTANVGDACGLINYSWQVVNNGDNSVAASGSGELDGSVASSFAIEPTVAIAPGDYSLKALVRDECQNEMVATSAMLVTSDKKPGVVCLTSLTAELTPVDTDQDGVIDDGCAVVWAQEYESSMTAACNDDSIKLYIERLDGIDDDTLDPEDADSLKVTCADFDPSTPLPVRLWVVSFPSGAMDYCDLVLRIQNNMNACQISRADVSGSIVNELEASVENVEVKATLANGQALNFLTTTGGVYRFANTLGIAMTVTPQKDSDHLNGISTADLIKIQKHILGKEILEGDYRKMAADANADGKINGLDLLELRRLILGVIPELTDSDAWRFSNTIDGAESYEVSGTDAMQVDFMGVKIGDVNLDSDPGRSMSRSSHALQISTTDRQLTAGEVHSIDLMSSALENFEGMQFTMAVNPSSFKILDVEGSSALGLTKDHFGTQALNAGQVSLSWNSTEVVDHDELPFASILVEALEDVRVSDAIAINSGITTAEAYTNEVIHDISLEFTTSDIDAEFALMQNQPNPFGTETTIGFVLPEALSVALTIYDVTGKLVSVQQGDFAKGYNQISLDKSQLVGASGVLYYQIDTEDHTATRKMIVLE